jgi:predicted nucleic acid-binding protein
LKLVLFDSDVLIDVLAQRQPFFPTSALALNTVAQGRVEGYVAGHAVTNIFYILRRQLGGETTRELLARLLLKLHVASVTDAVVRQALSSQITDFEDAVTSAAAIAAGVELIVTRNTPDFRSSPVAAMPPEMFLTTFLS